MADMVIRSPRVLLPSGIQPAEISVEGAYISSVRPYNPGIVSANNADIPSDRRNNPRIDQAWQGDHQV